VGSRTRVCADGRLTSHGSGWAEYQRREDERVREVASSAAEDKPAGKRRAGSRKPAQQAARLQRVGGVVDAHDVLLDDRAGVELLGHVVGGRPDDLHAAFDPGGLVMASSD